MRRALIGTAVLSGIVLGGCAQLSDALSSIFSIFKVDFSLDEKNAVAYGIQYPAVFTQNYSEVSTLVSLLGRTAPQTTAARAAAFDLSSILGTATQLLNQTNLNLTFNLKADNTKNKDRANFPFASALNLYVRDVAASSSPTTTGSISPFAISGGRDTSLAIPVTIPFSLITGNPLNDIIDGKAIPYRIAGRLAFALQSPLGDTLGKDTASMDLTSGNVPTRPSSGTDVANVFFKAVEILRN